MNLLNAITTPHETIYVERVGEYQYNVYFYIDGREVVEYFNTLAHANQFIIDNISIPFA